MALFNVPSKQGASHGQDLFLLRCFGRTKGNELLARGGGPRDRRCGSCPQHLRLTIGG